MIANDPILHTLWRKVRFAVHAGLAIGLTLAATTSAADQPGKASTLKATYSVSIGGMRVGRIDVEGSFSADRYSTAISGSTAGITRLFSDRRAAYVSRGRIGPSGIVPTSYFSETQQNNGVTQISMSLSAGKVTKLRAVPDPTESKDRIAIRSSHKRNIVDPAGALVVAMGRRGRIDGRRACSRTVRVFDGWQRYDVKLRFSKMKDIAGSAGAYSGPVAVCSARYVPIAGHERDRKYVGYMAGNRRMEVWLAPIDAASVMVPIHILVGTESGDLIIAARSFAVTAPERRTSLR